VVGIERRELREQFFHCGPAIGTYVSPDELRPRVRYAGEDTFPLAETHPVAPCIGISLGRIAAPASEKAERIFVEVKVILEVNVVEHASYRSQRAREVGQQR